MSNYDNTNTGALFGNNRKREGKKDPDLQGKIDIDGRERWVSGWFFTYDKDGQTRKAINLKLGDWVESKAAAQDRNPATRGMEDDIPF